MGILSKIVMKIFSTSPSDLQLYFDCPSCWLLKKQGHKQETSAAMAFGTKLHNALATYHKELPLFEWDTDIQPYLEAYSALYDPGYQVAEEFWKVQLLDTDITLNLKVDLVKDDLLIEHKTSSSKYSQQFVDNHRQITAYSWAWSKLYTQPEKGIRVNVFLTKPKPDEPVLQTLDTYRTKEHFTEWSEWVREILKGIEVDYFEPNEKARWHNYPACPAYQDRE